MRASRVLPFAIGGLLLVAGAGMVVLVDQQRQDAEPHGYSVRAAESEMVETLAGMRVAVTELKTTIVAVIQARPPEAPKGRWVRVASLQGAEPDGHSRVRAALDLVGGEDVGLEASSSCAGGTAAACANSDGYIKYSAEVATWSDSRLQWAMAHELAHIHQFRVWGALNDSGAYQELFGGDPELLANCMALVRGYAGAVGCDSDQQAWASGVWVGVVR
ncbi:hypothetical protein [Microbacterium sp. NPDC056234]|uniref:hypothetical protein n=1 Tax=Microbacterium sp. NPDC056234 TaxID=3345757 RepID=UPI0035D96C2D